MDGRWQLMVRPDGSAPGAAKAPDEGALRHGWACVPVVPCDDDALDRLAKLIYADDPRVRTAEDARFMAQAYAEALRGE